MNPIIARVAALPKTHKVITTSANGERVQYEAHSLASAENYAVRMRRMIETGEAVSVEVTEI